MVAHLNYMQALHAGSLRRGARMMAYIIINRVVMSIYSLSVLELDRISRYGLGGPSCLGPGPVKKEFSAHSFRFKTKIHENIKNS